MPRVRVIHWRAAEAAALIEVCRAIRAHLPDACVIDLSRLPSHGKEVAVWLRGAKSTRSIPIVFAGGDPLKVAAIRELLPDVTFCAPGEVPSALKRQARHANPAAPPGMMERSKEKSAAEKLGITAGAAVASVEAPRDFPGLLGNLPDSVEFRQDEAAPTTLWFVHDRQCLLENLSRMRTLAGRTRLWLLWRKTAKTSPGSGITQNALREITREVGLVDYKICSVNERWSAMLFARKKA